MRRALLVLLGTIALTVNSGCGIGDRMFSFHRPWGGGCGCNEGGCANCGDGGCGNGGCANGNCGNGGCAACGNGGDGSGDPNGYANDGRRPPHDMLPRGAGGTYLGQQGPPTGAVAYPYYTTRGPPTSWSTIRPASDRKQTARFEFTHRAWDEHARPLRERLKSSLRTRIARRRGPRSGRRIRSCCLAA